MGGALHREKFDATNYYPSHGTRLAAILGQASSSRADSTGPCYLALGIPTVLHVCYPAVPATAKCCVTRPDGRIVVYSVTVGGVSVQGGGGRSWYV